MRKLLSTLSVILVLTLTIFTPVYGASVPPQTFPGNDLNPSDFTPPEGCIHYEIPNSEEVGTHTIRFNTLGEVDPEGPYRFAVVVVQEQGEGFTKVLSWTSNFQVRSVIIKGEPAFNLYEYELGVREDTDLISPSNPAGDPTDIIHISIVICPDDFSTEATNTIGFNENIDIIAPNQANQITDTAVLELSFLASVNYFGVIGIIIIFIMLIIAFFLLGVLIGVIYLCPKKKKYKKPIPPKEDECKKCIPPKKCNHCKPRDRKRC